MELLDKILEKTGELLTEGQKFYDKGNKSAGTRTRLLAQEIKNLCQDLRKDVSAKKNEG